LSASPNRFCQRLLAVLCLENFFFSDFAEGFSSEFYRWGNDFVGLFVDGFSFYGFTAGSFGEKSSSHAHCVGAVWDVTGFFGPFTPYAIALVHCGVFCAFEGVACWRTGFGLCQCGFNLW
jgi:hypothetical protein